MEHRVNLTPAQVKKMLSGGAVTLKPSSFSDAGSHSLMLMPQSARKVATSVRKGKGLRVSLKGRECLEGCSSDGEIEGGKLNLAKAFKTVGKVLGSKKAIKIYKDVGRTAMPIAKKALDKALPALAKGVATYIGQPQLAPVIEAGAKVGVDAGYAKAAKEAGVKNPKSKSKKSGVTAIDEVGEIMRRQDELEKNLRALERGPKAIDDIGMMMEEEDDRPPTAIDEIGEMMGQSAPTGRGLRVSKGMRGVRVGGNVMKGSAVRSNGLRTGLRKVVVAEPASTIIQTGSPYAGINSAAMSPFLGASPQLDNKVIGKKSGGSMYPAGTRGGSFAPAG